MFQEEKSWFSTMEWQLIFCFHQSPPSSNVWLCLLETQARNWYKNFTHNVFKYLAESRKISLQTINCKTVFSGVYPCWCSSFHAIKRNRVQWKKYIYCLQLVEQSPYWRRVTVPCNEIQTNIIPSGNYPILIMLILNSFLSGNRQLIEKTAIFYFKQKQQFSYKKSKLLFLL